jgi:hypothetical protein
MCPLVYDAFRDGRQAVGDVVDNDLDFQRVDWLKRRARHGEWLPVTVDFKDSAPAHVGRHFVRD